MDSDTTDAMRLQSIIPGATIGQPDRVYKIGDLAKEYGLTLRTLRFYDDRNLLVPKRSGSTRLYSAKDKQRLQLIVFAKNLGFSLADVKELLELNDLSTLDSEVSNRIIKKLKSSLKDLDTRIAALEKTRTDVHEVIDRLEQM
jgi:DNA-binding transcriptional MerR regulator